jgi:hypothetical protein
VRRFAALTGVEELLRLHPAAPLGYYMDTLSSDRVARSCWSLRQRGWWWLAVLSGQLDEVVSLDASEVLSDSRLPRDARRNRALPTHAETLVVDGWLRDWLLSEGDEAADLLWNILAFVRRLRAAASSSCTAQAICAGTEAAGSRDVAGS